MQLFFHFGRPIIMFNEPISPKKPWLAEQNAWFFMIDKIFFLYSLIVNVELMLSIIISYYYLQFYFIHSLLTYIYIFYNNINRNIFTILDSFDEKKTLCPKNTTADTSCVPNPRNEYTTQLAYPQKHYRTQLVIVATLILLLCRIILPNNANTCGSVDIGTNVKTYICTSKTCVCVYVKFCKSNAILFFILSLINYKTIITIKIIIIINYNSNSNNNSPIYYVWFWHRRRACCRWQRCGFSRGALIF